MKKEKKRQKPPWLFVMEKLSCLQRLMYVFFNGKPKDRLCQYNKHMNMLFQKVVNCIYRGGSQEIQTKLVQNYVKSAHTLIKVVKTPQKGSKA